MPIVLTAEDLHVARGGQTVIAGVSFKVAAGQALLLKGPNGSGKTSLLRAIAGLLPPARGTLRLDGGDLELTIGQQCHLAGHLDAVKGRLTVAENLKFWAGYLDGNAASVAIGLEALDLVHLGSVPAGYLSAGQRRRLGLARLLIAKRPIWLLDEPTVSLDAASGERFAGIVSAHLDSGGIVVAATHVDIGISAALELRLGARHTNGLAA